MTKLYQLWSPHTQIINIMGSGFAQTHKEGMLGAVEKFNSGQDSTIEPPTEKVDRATRCIGLSMIFSLSFDNLSKDEFHTGMADFVCGLEEQIKKLKEELEVQDENHFYDMQEQEEISSMD